MSNSLFLYAWKKNPFKGILIAWLTCLTGEWIVFKLVYPFPNFVLDSYFYVEAAILHSTFNVWPIGYSKFIDWFSFFSHSPLLFTLAQYLLLQISLLGFFLSWITLFSPAKLLKHILFILLFVNPLFLFCANFVLSDSLFISCSILWFTQLLWLLFRPRRWMILIHAILITTAFTIRYNAMYYPLIAIMVYICSRQGTWVKIGGCILPLALIGSFVFYTSHQIRKFSGQSQFSPFGGWKLANNALYIYQYTYFSDTSGVSGQFAALDRQVRTSLSAMSFPIDLQYPEFSHGSYFMFAWNSPLLLYAQQQYPDGATLNSKGWNAISPLYQSYGQYLIRKHPTAFIQHFIWPNFRRYAMPPNVIFGPETSFSLNPGYAKDLYKLFRLKTLEVSSKKVMIFMNFQSLYPIVIVLFHLLFIIGYIAFIISGAYRHMSRQQKHCLALTLIIWLSDMAFNVCTAAVQLRYEIFSEIIEITFGIYLIGLAYRHLQRKEQQSGISLPVV